MKAVLAIDSFKGSLSSIEASTACAEAIKEIFPDAETIIYPLADGGEGTVSALTEGLGGEIRRTKVTGPLGNEIMSRYGYLPSSKTAVMEMADAAGLPMIHPNLRNPLNTTTYGLGELIHSAIDDGCRKFIIGIGGSATNDAGLGMLTALGVKFTKADGTPVGINGKDVCDIEHIDISGMDKRIKECTFHIACDVNNPLYGENGCSVVYGPQKGATPEIVAMMDSAIKTFAEKAEHDCQITGADIPGAGAAGGLGYAFHGFLNGVLIPGVQLILDAINIKEDLKNADILITGEGQIDFQTSMGKAPAGVAQLAKKVNPDCLTIAVCGSATPEAVAVNNSGIDAYFPILNEIITLKSALVKKNAIRNMKLTMKQIMNLLKAGKILK